MPVQRYASVEPDLYKQILNRCVLGGTCMADTMALDRSRGKFDPSAYICTAGNTAGGAAGEAAMFAADPALNDGRRLLR